MRDFYATSASMPLDQADGLRRLFAGARGRCLVPLVSNPHVPFSGAAIERLTAALAPAATRWWSTRPTARRRRTNWPGSTWPA